MTSIRVVIADDHAVVRRGLRAQLGGSGFVVVAEADDGAAAIEAALHHEPDVLVVELELPVVDGLTVTRVVRSARPKIAVVLLTTYERDAIHARARVAGAACCVLKDAGRETLSAAIGDAVRSARA